MSIFYLFLSIVFVLFVLIFLGNVSRWRRAWVAKRKEILHDAVLLFRMIAIRDQEHREGIYGVQIELDIIELRGALEEEFKAYNCYYLLVQAKSEVAGDTEEWLKSMAEALHSK